MMNFSFYRHFAGSILPIVFFTLTAGGQENIPVDPEKIAPPVEEKKAPPINEKPLSSEVWTVVNQSNLKDLAARAPQLKTEDVCTPVKSVRLSRTYTIRNPDSKSFDILQVYFKEYGGPNTIVIMDTGTGKIKKEQIKFGYNFHNAPGLVANGKLYITILNEKLQHLICTYDPDKDEFKLDALPMPPDLVGETHPMTLGMDGKIYCGGAHTSKTACVAQIDPLTDKVTSYGSLGPSHAPAPCWGYGVAADHRYTYITSGKTPWYLVAYDRQEGRDEVLLTVKEAGSHLDVSQKKDICECSVEIPGSANQYYWIHEGKLIPKKNRNEPSPWPPNEASPIKFSSTRLETSTAAATPDVNGNAVFWYHISEVDPANPSSVIPKKVPVGGGGEDEPPARVPDDATMQADGWKAFRYNVPTYPMAIYRLTELPDGRLVGTAGAYEGNFIYDPKTKQSEHPGKNQLSHYSTVFYEGKLYMSGYPNGPVYVYDPNQPWTAGKQIGIKVMDDGDPQANPRRLTYLKLSGAKTMYSAATGNGKVYFGGVWKREGTWGGLGWWDVRAGKEGGFWEPFSTYKINFITAADDGRTIVISTIPTGNLSLKQRKPENAALFFLDTATDQLVGDKLELGGKAAGSGPIVGVGGRRVLGWMSNPEDPKTSILYGVDATTRQLLFKKNIPFPLSGELGMGQVEAWDFRLGPDGKVWTFMDGKLVRINPKDASLQFVGKVGGAGQIGGGRLAFSGNDLYLAGTTSLRCVRGIVKP